MRSYQEKCSKEGKVVMQVSNPVFCLDEFLEVRSSPSSWSSEGDTLPKETSLTNLSVFYKG